ncbi:MAG: hypothetical protein JO104_05660 [Candidatus Eremiobacteraeota bacterium]|nr:hypothetical protein [Candidatus Eremiobacteraeota bacterium]
MPDRIEIDDIFRFWPRPGPPPDPASWVFSNLELSQAARVQVARTNIAMAKAMLTAQLQALETMTQVLDAMG